MFFSMGRAFLTCVNSLMCPYTCGLIILTDIVFCTRNGRTRGEDETTDCRHCVYGRAICYCQEDMQPLCAGKCRRTEVVKAMSSQALMSGSACASFLLSALFIAKFLF